MLLPVICSRPLVSVAGFFEVNYASFDASAFDALLGSYMDSFADRSMTAQAGPLQLNSDEKQPRPGQQTPQVSHRQGMPALPDAKSVIGLPSPAVAVYILGVVACFAAWAFACAAMQRGGEYSLIQAYLVGALAGCGPIALAYCLPQPGGAKVGAKSLGPALDWLMWGLGVASCALPVTCACAWCLLAGCA